jgi:hypothetical protein
MTNGSGDMTSAFEAALESASTAAVDASPASDPTPEPAPAEPSAPAATTQAAGETTETDPVSADAEKSKEPPQWRWQDILETQRKKAAEEAAARVTQEYEHRLQPYQGVSPEELQGFRVMQAALAGHPQAIAMVKQNPQALAALRSMVAEQQAVADDVEPQPDAAIQMADGSQVPVFTPQGMKRWQEWNQKHLESSLTQKFQPLMSTAERLRVVEQEAEQQRESHQWAASVLAPVKRLPYFAEFKPEILKAIQELPPNHTGPLDEVVYASYERLLSAKLEQSTKDADAKALASIHQRAVAGTSNPNRASGTEPAKFKAGAEGFAEALAHFSAS